MARVELIPTLDHCIETAAKKEYWRSVDEYLQGKGRSEKLEEKIELLRMFLESMDFRELRRQTEKYLLEGKGVRFIVYLEKGKPHYQLKVEPEASPFNSLASEYDAWFEREGKLIFEIEVQAFQQILPLLPKPWIEIGVGSGRFAQALGVKLGLDPSLQLLNLAKERGIRVFLGSGEEPPFRNASFGTAFLIVTLCFVTSPLEVLKETNRILKSDGKAVLGMVLRDSPWGQWYEQKKSQGHRFYKYATFYSYKEVKALLEQAGFSIEEVISTLFQKPSEVEHLEPPLKGFSSDAGFTIILAGKSLER